MPAGGDDGARSRASRSLAAEVKRWFDKAEEMDAAENREYGERRGDDPNKPRGGGKRIRLCAGVQLPAGG